MATRSTIAIQMPDGKIRAVYIHWDGHVETNGVILAKNYKKASEALALMYKGSMSELHEKIEDCIYHVDQGNYSISYNYENLNDYLDNHPGEEFNYIFTGRTWKVVRNKKLYSLNRMIAKL